MSTVTFVVLTNDEERTISRRLWELRHQDVDPATVESIEVVVVDGNSTDRTLLLAVPFADALAVAAADRAAQEDLGRRIATGEVCVIVDADTVISPWLARDAVTASTAPADLGEHDRQLAPA